MGGESNNTGSCPDRHQCNGTLAVTGEIAKYLRGQGFEGFAPNTHLVAAPHFLPDLIDWMSALIDMGMKPQNIHLIGKQYSQVDAVRDKLRKIGIDVVDYTPTPMGQYYETLQNVDMPKFWEHSMEKIRDSLKTEGAQNILVMDDGGRLLRSIPTELLNNPDVKIAGIEQTTNGFDVAREEGHSIDIVIPAMSALKLEFEPPFIADAVLRKLRDKLGIFKNRDVAVVGIGKIGGALCETLADNHNNIYVYDTAVSITDGVLNDPKNLLPSSVNIYEAPAIGHPKSEAKLIRASQPPSSANYYVCNGLEQAVQNTNYVFGCTGRDIFKDIDLDKMTFQGVDKRLSETRFISVSSGDKEFLSLLQWISKQPNHLHHGPETKLGSRWDVTLNHNGNKMRVLQQGFPINFDGKTGSGTPEEMQLISSFLMASVVQGYEYLKKYPVKSTNDGRNLIMLSPAVQRKIMETWLDKVPSIQGLYKPDRIAEIMTDSEWFARHSKGESCPVFAADLPTPECLVQKAEPANSQAQEKDHGQKGQ